jgi:small subunit ribosomal protein S11
LDYIKKDKKKKILKDLKRIERVNLLKLVDMRCYRGVRHTTGLPVRGQRSHSNGNTQHRLSNLRLGTRQFSTLNIFNSFYKKVELNKGLQNKVSFDLTNSVFFENLLNEKFPVSLKNLEKKNFLLFNKNKFKKKKNTKKHVMFTNFKLNEDWTIVHIYCKLNNILISAYNHLGELKILTSGGLVGFKGRRKYTDYAAKMAVDRVISKIKGTVKSKNLKKKQYIVLKLRGFGKARKAAVKRFKKRGLKIKIIEDITPISHNGCKSKKIRRI